MKKEITCVVCPSGCKITVEGEGRNISRIEGFGCKRGEDYAKDEFIEPKRILTTTVKAEGYSCPVIAVRSESPLPKNEIFKAMEEIRKVTAVPPFYIGKVVVGNILDTGVDIVLANC